MGSILGALKAIVSVQGMTRMTPPIKDLLPRLTPILKNRHEKVQNMIDLIGLSPTGQRLRRHEWMHLLNSWNFSRRRKRFVAPPSTPSVTSRKLSSARRARDAVEQSQGARASNAGAPRSHRNRAETCAPFTVLPALMNEYRVPELNVQNGIEILGLFVRVHRRDGQGLHRCHALFEDALMDRDLVHRQTAAVTVKHLALGCAGLGCEDAVTHLINYTWPNVFEPSPHVINAVIKPSRRRVALGPQFVLAYTLQGLFHPARKVRDIYWKIYNTLYIGSEDAKCSVPVARGRRREHV